MMESCLSIVRSFASRRCSSRRTLPDPIIREVDEELGAKLVDLVHVAVVENIFPFNGQLGHEVVALYSGRLIPTPGEEGGLLTESDGSTVPVVWRPFDDAELTVPLYPSAARAWLSTVGE